MKVQLVVALCAVFVASQAGAAEKTQPKTKDKVSQAGAAEKTQLKTKKDKVSYTIGLDMGNSLKQQKIDVDPKILARGIKDGLSGAKPLMTEQELKDTVAGIREELMARQKEQMAKQQEEMKVLGEKNKKEGEANPFLERHRKDPREGHPYVASVRQVIGGRRSRGPNFLGAEGHPVVHFVSQVDLADQASGKALLQSQPSSCNHIGRRDMHADSVLWRILQPPDPRGVGRIHTLDDQARTQCAPHHRVPELPVGKWDGAAVICTRSLLPWRQVQIFDDQCLRLARLQPGDEFACEIPDPPSRLIPRQLPQVGVLQCVPLFKLALPVNQHIHGRDWGKIPYFECCGRL